MRAYERLLHYVSFGTQSDHTSETVPSTPNQKVLAAALVEEMKKLGIADAFVDDKGYVYGTIPATKGKEDKPVIGFAPMTLRRTPSAREPSTSFLPRTPMR